MILHGSYTGPIEELFFIDQGKTLWNCGRQLLLGNNSILLCITVHSGMCVSHNQVEKKWVYIRLYIRVHKVWKAAFQVYAFNVHVLWNAVCHNLTHFLKKFCSDWLKASQHEFIISKSIRSQENHRVKYHLKPVYKTKLWLYWNLFTPISSSLSPLEVLKDELNSVTFYMVHSLLFVY